jgi:hypothetical protein
MISYKSYLATMDNYKDVLAEYGVCVIPDIMSKYECIARRQCIWNDIKYVTQNRFNIDDSNTWKSFYDLYPIHSMLLHHFGVGHFQQVWEIRQNELIGDIFADIWNTNKNNLYSSFDGISIALPPEQTNKGWYKGNDWVHTDQGPRKKSFACIQGMINLYPVNTGDATLMVLEKSHLYHNEFFEDNDKNFWNDWYLLRDNQEQYFIDRGCQRFCVSAPIGSLILWDSRTYHQGIEAFAGRNKKNFRMAIYVCLMPKNTYPQKMINKRKKLLKNTRLTNHWGTNLFPIKPNTYGKPLETFNKIPKPVLTPYGKSLVY